MYKRNQLNNNTTTQSVQQHTIATATNDYRPTVPQQPYKCYNRGEDGHFIRNCPYFQGWGHRMMVMSPLNSIKIHHQFLFVLMLTKFQ